MFRNFKMVSKVVFGRGCFRQLGDILKEQRQGSESVMVFLVDDVFKKGTLEKPSAAKCRRSDGMGQRR
jgi:3-deoxy-alpha-D-manno-octulosonate 8-oxidase